MSVPEQKNPRVQCYLAGPDVFFPDAVERGAHKKKLLAAQGIHGHFPFDNEVPPHLFEGDGGNASAVIAEENEKMMLRCVENGDIGVIMINMTPWRGPEMDTGTAFEAGFFSAMRRMGKPVILVGYYETPTPDFYERTKQWCKMAQGTEPQLDARGVWRDANGHALEKFGKNQDNLMIDESIKRAGGFICHSFEEAVRLTGDLTAKLQKEIQESPLSGSHSIIPQGRMTSVPSIGKRIA